MGLIEILDHEKDEIIAKLESDLKTLETKNIELKYTNRKLITTVSEQKKMLKVLKSKLKNLEYLKNHPGPNNLEELKIKYQKLLTEHEDLKLKYEGSKKEMEELKNSKDSDTKSGQGLFGRFLKRNDTDKTEENNGKKAVKDSKK